MFVARKVVGPDGHPSVSGGAVNACLRRVSQMHGEAVLTTEGLGSASDMHPIQKSMVQHAATQCGYWYGNMRQATRSRSRAGSSGPARETSFASSPVFFFVFAP